MSPAVKALENALGVEPPKLANEIRELLLLGQLIQNQATSLFIFTMPDRVGASSIFHMDDSEANPEQQLSLAQRALKVRQIGTKLITLAGGQFIHPVKAIIGGVTSGIKAEDAKQMLKEMQDTLPMACELFMEYWDMSLAMKERIGTWGDDQPAYYIASTGVERPNFNSSTIRVLGPNGIEKAAFPPERFREFLDYQTTDYSFAGKSSYDGEVLRANSLARINLVNSMGTPCADHFLDRLTSQFGKPAHPILLFDLCRGIELVYAFERAIEMLSEDLDYEDTSVPYSLRDGEGYGLVEAPRGPLIHHYTIENGLIADAEFIIPTVHNMGAIERALKVAGERYITPQGINLELEKSRRTGRPGF